MHGILLRLLASITDTKNHFRMQSQKPANTRVFTMQIKADCLGGEPINNEFMTNDSYIVIYIAHKYTIVTEGADNQIV